MLGFPEAQIIDICGPLEVFSRTSRLISGEARRGPDVYTVELLAHRAGPVRTSSGLALIAARSFKNVRSGVDTLMVAGGRGVEAALGDRALIIGFVVWHRVSAD
jgi:putative intracellular protease/amidase